MGFNFGSRSLCKYMRTDSIPSLLGMLVYRLVTSRVAIIKVFYDIDKVSTISDICREFWDDWLNKVVYKL